MSGTDCHLAGLGVMYEHRVSLVAQLTSFGCCDSELSRTQSQDPERWNVPGHEGYLSERGGRVR